MSIRIGFGQETETRPVASFDVPSGAWVAVAVRRLVPRMGLDVLLDAWRALVASTDGPVLLLVAGVGPSREALEIQVAPPRTDRACAVHW